MSKIVINPREPLTKKARAAIEKYVEMQGERLGRYQFVLIDSCLKAERMKREQLYEVLESKGWRWSARLSRWIK